VSDIDSLLRERLEATAAFDVAADPRGVHQAIAKRQRQIRRRRRTTGLLCVSAAAMITLGVGLVARQDPGHREVVAPPADQPATTDGPTGCGTYPHFRAAPGWEVTQGPSSATAANVALGPRTSSGDAPWDTVDRLTEGDVVLYAMTYRANEIATDDPTLFPVRELPLTLEEAEPGGLEGQPDHVTAERLTGRVDDWIIDLVIFYGNHLTGQPQPTDPSDATREAAQRQLALLKIPPQCPVAP
jgi:hypothetical protein